MTPNRDVVKSKFVPPQVEHRLIESRDSFLRDSGRRRNELAQAVVDEDSLFVIDTRQEMPQRECITLASRVQDDRHIVCALLRRTVLKIESRQRSPEFQRCILEVRRAGTDLRPGRASCTRRYEGLVAIQLESDPPEGCAHHPRARIVDPQSVGANTFSARKLHRAEGPIPSSHVSTGDPRS